MLFLVFFQNFIKNGVKYWVATTIIIKDENEKNKK